MSRLNSFQKKSKRFLEREKSLRNSKGCLTDCVAYFLNIHMESVPYFVFPVKGWNERLKDYFRTQGYEVWWDYCKTPPKRGVHIVCGDSLGIKNAAHAVVYRNGKLAFDPQYPSHWKDSRITHRLRYRRIVEKPTGRKKKGVK